MKKILLICLPFAGGSAYELTNQLRTLYNSNIKCIGIDYPGHGKKITQPLLTNPEKLIEDLGIEIHNYISNYFPVYLLGYSMGSSLIPGILRFLKNNYQQQPEGIILCSVSSPKLKNKNKFFTSKTKIIKLMHDNGATPQAVLENKELMSIFIPIMQADLNLLSNLKEEPRITVPAEIIFGKNDLDAINSINYWQKKINKLTVCALNGNHFFLYKHQKAFINEVAKFIQRN